MLQAKISVEDTSSAQYFGAVGDGVADDSVAISGATGVKELRFPAGTYLIGENATIAPDIYMATGAVFLVDDGVTLTITGQIHAENQQIFKRVNTGKVSVNTLSQHSTVQIAWFLDKQAEDHADGFKWAMLSNNGGGGILEFPPYTMSVGSKISFDSTSAGANVTDRTFRSSGVNPGAGILLNAGYTDDCLFDINGLNAAGGWLFRLKFDGIYIDESNAPEGFTTIRCKNAYSTKFCNIRNYGALPTSNYMDIEDCNDVVLDGVTGSNGHTGIRVTGNQQRCTVTIRDCDLEAYKYGIETVGAAHVTVDAPYFERNGACIWHKGDDRGAVTVVGGSWNLVNDVSAIRVEGPNLTVTNPAVEYSGTNPCFFLIYPDGTPYTRYKNINAIGMSRADPNVIRGNASAVNFLGNDVLDGMFVAELWNKAENVDGDLLNLFAVDHADNAIYEMEVFIVDGYTSNHYSAKFVWGGRVGDTSAPTKVYEHAEGPWAVTMTNTKIDPNAFHAGVTVSHGSNVTIAAKIKAVEHGGSASLGINQIYVGA